MHFRSLNIFLLTFLSFTIFTSCSHYSKIQKNNAPFKSIYLHTVSNQNFVPNVHALFQSQIKNTILRGSHLLLAKNADDADLQLYVTINNYNRNANTRSNLDPGRFDSLNLRISILISLFDNQNNTYLLKDVQIESHESLFYDVTESSVNHREIEYQVLPKITKELSEKTLHLITGHWSRPLNN